MSRLLGFLLGLLRWRKSSRRRLLTEEEYRQQGEMHTSASLEELRKHCINPGFPAWDTVLKLQSPQRFARFLHGSSHVSALEIQNHEQHFGAEAQWAANGLLDSGQTSPASDDISEDELDSSSHNPPNSLPILISYPPAAPAAPATPTTCPYPLVSFTPLPETALTDDDDEPF